MGIDVMAITGELPGPVSTFMEEKKIGLHLLSDPKQAAAIAFGIAYRVEDSLYEKYKGFGVDLEKVSGEKRHILPVPAVFVIDEQGVVQFSYANPDYTVRLDPEVPKAAARAALKPKE